MLKTALIYATNRVVTWWLNRPMRVWLAVFASMTVSISSFAAPVTIQMTGVVDDTNYNGAGTGVLFPTPPSAGTVFIYLVTYDPALATNYSSGPGFSRFSGAITNTKVIFNSQTFVFPSLTTNNIDVFGGGTVLSRLTFVSGSVSPICNGFGTHTISASVDFSGPVGYFADTSIPIIAPNLSVFGTSFGFSVNNSSPGTGCVDSADSIHGHITNISLVPPSSENPIVSLSTSTLDFGIIATGANKDQTFAVSNSGGGTLTGVITAAPPFSIVSGNSFALGAGSSNTVTVRLAPTVDGIFSQTLNIAGMPFKLGGTSVTPPTNAPIITQGPSPTPQGGKATVLGKNFGLASPPTVTVGGLPAIVTAWDPIHADFIVPQTGGGSANVVLCTSTCSPSKKMLVIGAAPVIVTKTSTIHTTSGSMLVIDGQNFGAGPTVDVHSVAVIGTAPVTLISWNNQRIVMRVPVLPKGTYALRIGTRFGLTSASIRYADVTAVISTISCDSILSFSLTCPPIEVSVTNSANGLVNLLVKNTSGRWYALRVEPSGGASVPGANIGRGVVLPVTTILPIGPNGTYNFTGVLLPKVGSVTITADATLNFAIAASTFDYMAGTVCPLLTLAAGAACPPRLRPDLGQGVSFLNDLIASAVPVKLVGALQKISLSLVPKPSPIEFVSAVGDLADAIQSDQVVYTYLISKGFTGAGLTAISRIATYVTLPWKIAVTFWDTLRSSAAPTVGTVVVVGR